MENNNHHASNKSDYDKEKRFQKKKKVNHITILITVFRHASKSEKVNRISFKRSSRGFMMI